MYISGIIQQIIFSFSLSFYIHEHVEISRIYQLSHHEFKRRQWTRTAGCQRKKAKPNCILHRINSKAVQNVLLIFLSNSVLFIPPQPNNFFNQLHVYSPKTNNWSFVPERVSRAGQPSSPPGRAGHAASVVGDRMIMFGGSRAHSTRLVNICFTNI